MIISDSDLEEFRAIYRKCYGEDISKEDAFREAINLVEILRLFSKPISKEDFLALHHQLITLWHESRG